MFRLIEPNLSTAGKLHLRDGAPSLLLNWRTLDAFISEGGHLGFEVIAHEVEFMGAVFARWMDRGLSWRQREDQPAMSGIYVFEAEEIAEERTVCLRIFAVENNVSS